MSAVAETSFFHPKNVGFSNSILGWVADANPKMNWLRPKPLPRDVWSVKPNKIMTLPEVQKQEPHHNYPRQSSF